MKNAIQARHFQVVAMVGWLNRYAHHLTTFSFGSTS